MTSPSRTAITLKSALLALLVSFPTLAQDNRSAGSRDYEKALEEYNQNDFETSYIHLKNSLQKAPDYLPSKILMGKVLMVSGFIREAELELVEALAAGADPNLVVDSLGKTWLFLEKYDEIFTARYRGLTPETQRDWMVITATAYLATEQVDQARDTYLKALSRKPDSVRILNALASLEMAEENKQRAMEYLNKALASPDQDANSWRLMGDLQAQSDDIESAIASYQKGYELDAKNPILLRSLVAAYIRADQSDKAKGLLEDILLQTPGDPTASLLKAWLLATTDNPIEANNLLQQLSADLSDVSEEMLSSSPDLKYIRALSAYALNKYEQASNYFSDYVTSVPDNVEAAQLYARTLLKLGQPKLALEVLKKHERALSKDLEGSLLLGELYLSSSRNFKTVEILSRLRRSHPDDRRVKLLEVKTLVSRGKLDQALEELDRSPYLKTDLSFVLAKSMLLLQAGEIDKANSVADQLLKLSGDNEDFLNFKAAVLIRMQRWDEAESYVDKVLEINPDHYSARFNKATIISAFGEFDISRPMLQALVKEQPNNLDSRIMLARAMAETGFVQEAIDDLEVVLDKDLNNRRAMELLSALYAQTNKLDKAVRQVNGLIKLQNTSPKYLLQRIELYIAKEQTSRAMNEIDRIYKYLEDDPLGLFELSKLQLKTGQLSGAKKSIIRANELVPDNLFLASEYIRIHLLDDEFGKAEKRLAALTADTSESNAQLLLLTGDIALAKGKPENATQSYYAALATSPRSQVALAKIYQMTLRGYALEEFETRLISMMKDFPDDLFQLNLFADFLMNQGRFDEAEPHYVRLSTDDRIPNRAAVFNNLANIYISKDLNKANDFVKKAIDIGPVSAALLDTQGWILALSGRFDQALTVLRRAYSMDAKEPSIRYHLGYTLHKMGRTDEAKEELNQALATKRRFSERDRATALLESI